MKYSIVKLDTGNFGINSENGYLCGDCGLFHTSQINKIKKFSTSTEAERFLADYIWKKELNKKDQLIPDFNSSDWYVNQTNSDFYIRGGSTFSENYLWKNGKASSSTGSSFVSGYLSDAPGYWKTKEEAEDFLNSLKGNKMDNLDQKIEQYKKELASVKANLDALLQEKKAKKTYKRGQMFKVEGELSILAIVDFDNTMALIDIKDGNRRATPCIVKDVLAVTEYELRQMTLYNAIPVDYHIVEI